MKVTILQWNIWFQEDIQNVVKLLKHINPDIACLQELTINHPAQKNLHTPDIVANELGYNNHYSEIAFELKDHKLGNGIFTRFPIKSKRSALINKPSGGRGYDDEYRAYVESSLDINGARLTVGTTHMSYTKAFEVTSKKLIETDKLLDQIKNNKQNYILTGDFNAKPESEVIKKVSAILKNAGPDYTQKSWTTKPFSYDGFEANTLDWRLDYVFTTPDIKVISAEIINTEFSDHLPVLVQIEI